MAKHTPREDQGNLPGTNEKNDRVHKAAKQYAKFRDLRMEAGDTESEAHEKLMEIMKEEGLDTYSYADVDVTISHKEKAKVIIGGQSAAKGKDADSDDE